MGSTTADNIINTIRDTVSRGEIIPPGDWLLMAFDLNALIGEENDKYAMLYQNAYQVQMHEIKEGNSAAQAEALMKSSNPYREMLIQKGKISQIEEFIRIAKIRGSQADREMEFGNI